jgi:lipid A ethanolaminephosphotransferase
MGSSDPAAAAAERTGAWVRLANHPELILAVLAVFWGIALNRGFLDFAAQASGLDGWALFRFVGGLGVSVVALHWLILLAVMYRWTWRVLLAVLLSAAASSAWFIDQYGIHIDPAMIRNVLRTDPAEARELLSFGLLFQIVFYAGVPAFLFWRIPRAQRSILHAVLTRVGFIGIGLLLLLAALLTIMQPLSSFMRNHREARYLINPASAVWSLVAALRGDVAQAVTVIRPIGLDASLGPRAVERKRPLRIVLVVGETVRGANWGLNGYARDTTPELRAREVINFSRVSSCGTNTEVSLPCMFAPVGRRQYDELTIRTSESLLHVLNRAGYSVLWRDNQSGCKGVCRDLPYEQVTDRGEGWRCQAGRCPDEMLFEGLESILDSSSPNGLLVLHMLGNHGPSYGRRYPSDRAVFVPDCRSDELSKCTQQSIVNAYDNAILHTDRLLAGLIDQMRARSDREDAVVIYLSDHGESLGERGLFLHGVPWAIAPVEQTWVPWVFWFSSGAAERIGVDLTCLAERARQPAQHDHLFHTLLSIADVRTALYDPEWDLIAACRTMTR